MTRKAISIYMTATCAMAIVAPGRLAVGIILAVESCLIFFIGILFRSFLQAVKIKELRSTALCALIVAFTILFKQLLILLMPETALQLSYIIYLPAMSSFTSVFIFEETKRSVKEEFGLIFTPSIIFALYILFFSLVRDVFGFGTITLPAAGRMLEIVIFSSEYISAGTYLATIPGALVLSALFLAAFLSVEEKFHIIKKAGINI